MKRKINLQLFAEEDAILPDDIDSVIPETESEQQPTGEGATPTTESEQQTSKGTTEQTQTEQTKEIQPQKIKIKYNHEEKEISLDEAVMLAQKGMNYDKVMERLKQLESDPRLLYVNQQAQKYNMTPEQYIEAVRKQEEQEKLNELIQKNIPADLAREILENRKFREEIKKKEEAAAAQEKKQKEYQDFLTTFPDVKAEDIPTSVWQQVDKGVPLKYAYMEHAYTELKNALAAAKQKEEVSKKAVVGSVTEHGSKEETSEDPFLIGFNSI